MVYDVIKVIAFKVRSMQKRQSFITNAFLGKAAGTPSSYDFVMSTESVDRMGDVIEASSWKLTTFKKNPIALFAHSHRSPIGTWENVKVLGKQLVGTLKLARRGTSRFIDELHELVDQGILKAVSVGFIPHTMSPREDEGKGKKQIDGYLLKDCELLECSLVAVPANADAMLISKSMSEDIRRLAFAEPGLVGKSNALLGPDGEPAASAHPRIASIRKQLNLARDK